MIKAASQALRLFDCDLHILQRNEDSPALVETGTPGIVLIDGPHGLSMWRDFKAAGNATAGLSCVPLLYMMDSVEVELPDEASSATFDIVRKPVTANELLLRVRLLLKLNETQRQLEHRTFQLNATLERIEHGICLFDVDRRVIMSNPRYAEIYGLNPKIVRPGLSLEEILEQRVTAGTAPIGALADYISKHTGLGNRTRTFVTPLQSGQVIQIRLNRTEEGGWVSSHKDITKDWQAQKELKRARKAAELAANEAAQSAERLVDAFNVVPEGLALFDAQDRYLLWNDHYRNIYDKSGDKITKGMSFEHTLRVGLERGQYPEAVGREEEWLKERLDRHRAGSATHEQKLPDDRWIRIHERRTADGGSVGVRIDITDLKKREASFRLLFESNPVPMWVFDRQTLRFLDVNQAALDHYGFVRDRFLQMTLLDIRPKADWEAVRASVDRKNDMEDPRRVWRHIKANGEPIDVEIYAAQLTYRDRSASLVAIVDITERKKAEEELRTTQEFLHSVIESVPVTVLVKDAQEQRYVLVNRAGEDLMGVARQDLIGKTASEIFPQSVAEKIDAMDAQLLETSEPEMIFRNVLETSAKGPRVINASAVAVRDTNGTPRFLLRVLDDVTERLEAEQRIQHLSLHDPLTDLPNRAAFVEELNALLDICMETGSEFAIICLDLDRFKEINDIHGHDAGDSLLTDIAAHLSEMVAPNFLARLGGDEFIILDAQDAQPASSIDLAERLIAGFDSMSLVNEEDVPISASFGVSVFPSDGTDAKTLMAHADAALTRAKQDGRGVARFFEPAMDRHVREKRALQRELERAFRRRQLSLHYQPRALICGKIVGFEALLRWSHPEKGMIPPSKFIPLAEESGLIREIGTWVIREACCEAAGWPHDISVSVNLSPVQFRDCDLTDLVRTSLVETGLPPNRLEVEITESVLIGDHNHALTILRGLKALGVQIAMDDFGTGYSSLSYLQSFPFDRIKIDQSFIRLFEQPQSEAIVRAVIGLGRSLNLPVTAEGVETEKQRQFLEKEDCDEIQGYLIGKPAPIETYANVLGGGQQEKNRGTNRGARSKL
jgi:diguanylate cyclase (GGDEF)-like protein/PAS domain S-box-containing protein